jgi:hypothetical protein
MLRLRGGRINGLDPGAVPGASTKILLRRESFYGGEIGSTDVVKTQSRSRCASDRNRKKTTIANDNFAAEDFRLAA